MEQEISPEQKAQLETWAGKRDLLLLEISNLRTEKDRLGKSNIELVNSYSDIEARANQTIGRLIELQKKESELPLLISKDIAELEVRKSVLETEITNFSKMIDILSIQKISLENDVSLALSNFNTIKSETLLLDKVVDHVTRVSSNNAVKIHDLVSNLAKSLGEIIEVNKKNVFETNIVIDKLPKMLMEAQRHGLIKNKI